MTVAPTIVVTGIGVVSALGMDRESSWSALLEGAVGTRELSRFDTASLSCHRGGEVRDAPGSRALRTGPGRSLTSRMTMWATREAVEDARITAMDVNPERFGVVLGSVMATRPSLEAQIDRELGNGEVGHGDDKLNHGEDETPEWVLPSLLARLPAEALELRGPNCVLSSACASGNSAIAFGSELLRAGHADAMIAGGADEISYAMLLMFESFRALAADCVKPFDRDRDGLMLADGAAALVLEREPDARARGARIYGRVLGYANSCDAHHMTAPHPRGRGAVRSMRTALRRAEAQPCDIDCINAHGTGTPSNDAIEAYAIRTVFGADADHVPVSSLKGALGHAQGAASAIEAASCLLSLRDGVVPATANHSVLDSACDLDVVAGKPRKAPLRMVLNNAFGFGGNVECIAFGAA